MAITQAPTAVSVTAGQTIQLTISVNNKSTDQFNKPMAITIQYKIQIHQTGFLFGVNGKLELDYDWTQQLLTPGVNTIIQNVFTGSLAGDTGGHNVGIAIQDLSGKQLGDHTFDDVFETQEPVPQPISTPIESVDITGVTAA